MGDTLRKRSGGGPNRLRDALGQNTESCIEGARGLRGGQRSGRPQVQPTLSEKVAETNVAIARPPGRVTPATTA